jgi:hypothetical protein
MIYDVKENTLIPVIRRKIGLTTSFTVVISDRTMLLAPPNSSIGESFQGIC